jgi:hypothetical protein
MQGANDGLRLAPDVMTLLGEREILLDLDIYSASDEEEDPSNLT